MSVVCMSFFNQWGQELQIYQSTNKQKVDQEEKNIKMLCKNKDRMNIFNKNMVSHKGS